MTVARFVLVAVALTTVFLAPAAVAGPTESELLARFQTFDATPPTTGRLDDAQIARLLPAVLNHPIAGLAYLAAYDPTGEIGFCFGRAMAAYLLARQMGLHPQSLAKLFIVGDLRSGENPEWYFHVTTLVRRLSDGRWMAIDPILGAPMLAEEWIRTVKATWDKPNKANLYLTPGHVVFPDIHHSPTGHTGRYLMETTFKPWEKAGFRAQKLGTHDVYLPDRFRLDEHFFGTRTDRPFQFLGIEIGGRVFPYNDYFVRLLDSVSGGGTVRPYTARALAGREAACPATARNALGSPLFWRQIP